MNKVDPSPEFKKAPGAPAPPLPPSLEPTVIANIVDTPGASEPVEKYSFLSPPLAPDELGRLGSYRVLKVLGKGGMGIVFQAEDPHLQRAVAIKAMLPSVLVKESARERFKREAQLTASFEHDNIVTIHHVGEAVGADGARVPYLVMQFLKGMTLEDYLAKGRRLGMGQVLRVGREIARGLAAAHARGLIHRDIKPANIWLDANNQGRVKILDFGLARPASDETQLTQEGMIVGTPSYMSPEQARSRELDARTDLFSLGCVLYRLVAGKLPFQGVDVMATLMALASEEPTPVLELNPATPPVFAALIHQLLAKSPEQRPASAKAVADAIQAIEKDVAANRSQSDLPVEAIVVADSNEPTIAASTSTAPSWRTRHWWRWLAGAALMLVILGILGSLTDKGTVILEAGDPKTLATLNESGVRVKNLDRDEETLLRVGQQDLRSGKYEVLHDRLPGFVSLTPLTFDVAKGTQLTLKARVADLPAPLLASAPFPPSEANLHQERWAKYLGRPIVDRNSLSMRMVLIPPGVFVMGTSNSENGLLQDMLKAKLLLMPSLLAERPAHQVKLTRPFLMCENETTVSAFAQFVAAAKYSPKSTTGDGGGGYLADAYVFRPEFNFRNIGVPLGDNHPAVNVAKEDAEAFCAWLSKAEGKTYRLPTEAEWEFACRAGTTTLWSFGDDFKEGIKHQWTNVNSGHSPMPVGQLAANPFGLHDMHGNVFELCSDWFDPFYYKRSPAQDPQGPPSGREGVARGGCFSDPALASRSAARQRFSQLGAHIGFRIVCEIDR